jgi:hypothetical protein
MDAKTRGAGSPRDIVLLSLRCIQVRILERGLGGVYIPGGGGGAGFHFQIQLNRLFYFDRVTLLSTLIEYILNTLSLYNCI